MVLLAVYINIFKWMTLGWLSVRHLACYGVPTKLPK